MLYEVITKGRVQGHSTAQRMAANDCRLQAKPTDEGPDQASLSVIVVIVVGGFIR